MGQVRAEAIERACARPCPICGGKDPSPFLCKDFNISCNDYFEGRRNYPDNLGDVHYVECRTCGFVWAPSLHDWPAEAFRQRVYNEDYALCDPPFETVRPRMLAAWVSCFVGGRSLLDYGGGNGTTARELRAAGVDAVCWDPFFEPSPPPAARFGLVTAFEVVEHVPDQSALFGTLAGLCGEGLLVFSTLLRPRGPCGDWWYACARNGHVSLHTRESLGTVAEAAGLSLRSLGPEIHVAVARGRETPPDIPLPATPINGTPGYRMDAATGAFLALDPTLRAA